MMGKPDGDQEGIIPRICRNLFQRISNDTEAESQFSVEVSRTGDWGGGGCAGGGLWWPGGVG